MIGYNGLPGLIAALPRIVSGWVARTTFYIERLARQTAPVDTGNLRNSSASHVELRDGRIEGEVAFNAFYAAYVNFGTGMAGLNSNVPLRPPWVTYGSGTGMRAQPFLSFAAEQAGAELGQAVHELAGYIRAAV